MNKGMLFTVKETGNLVWYSSGTGTIIVVSGPSNFHVPSLIRERAYDPGTYFVSRHTSALQLAMEKCIESSINPICEIDGIGQIEIHFVKSK